MPIYMSIRGIEGESTNERHRGWFDVFSFSWGEHLAALVGGGGGGGAGRVSMQDFSITKPSGKGSPPLFLACASGRHLPAVQFEITMVNEESEMLLQRFRLENCMITTFEVGGDGGSRPTESLSLNFTKIEFTQVFLNADGVPTEQVASWDLQTNRGG